MVPSDSPAQVSELTQLAAAANPKRLMRRLMVSFATTGLLLFAAQLVIQPKMAKGQERVGVVNSLGRQRVFSLRVLEQALGCALRWRQECATELARASDELSQGHGAAIMRFYQHFAIDDARFRAALPDVLAEAERFAAQGATQGTGGSPDALHAAVDAYVSSVDDLMAQASATSQRESIRMRITAALFFAVIIAMLLIQALVVFRPAVRAVSAHIAALTQAHDELERAAAHVKQLQGLIPICMYCKGIRDVGQKWQRLESYLAAHADVEFSHGICEACYAKHHTDDDQRGQAGK